MYIIFTTSSASLTTCDSLATNYSISECHLLCAKLSCLCVCVCVCVTREIEMLNCREGESMWCESESIKGLFPSLSTLLTLFTAADVASFPTSPVKQWGKITACLSLLHSLQFHNILRELLNSPYCICLKPH